LRGTIQHGTKKTTYLPSDICAKHGVSEEDIYQLKTTKQIEDVVFEIADFAKGNLDHARTLNVPKEAFPVLNYALISEIILDKLQKKNFNIMTLEYTPDFIRLKLQIKLLVNKWKNKF
jgi:NADH dehydrogenase [ubiquinone] 1 alpha subcomplex assembly factor 6